MPTGKPKPLENASIEIPPVITVDVIRPVCTMPVIVLNRSTFLAFRSRTLIWSRRYASISVNFFKEYVCGSCGAVWFKPGCILLVVSLSYMLVLYLIVGYRMSSG